MRKDIRLIGLDLDNTTLNSKKEITPRVRAAIEKAIERGIHVLPSTGRMLSGVPESFTQIPGVRYAITSNGAKAFDLLENTELYSDAFDHATALGLLQACRKYDKALVSTFLDGTAYSDVFDPEQLRALWGDALVEYFTKCRVQTDNIVEIVKNSPVAPEKITLTFLDAGQCTQAWEDFMAREDCCCTGSSAFSVELNTPTANKGVALLALGERLGLAREQVMAIGDGLNDLEMLRAAGHAVAMGDSPPELLEVADEVTLTADEDGVALAIEKILAQL